MVWIENQAQDSFKDFVFVLPWPDYWFLLMLFRFSFWCRILGKLSLDVMCSAAFGVNVHSQVRDHCVALRMPWVKTAVFPWCTSLALLEINTTSSVNGKFWNASRFCCLRMAAKRRKCWKWQRSSLKHPCTETFSLLCLVSIVLFCRWPSHHAVI